MNWLNSTNAKEIGTLYLIFAVFAGMIGTAFSVLIRLELSSPGVQFLQGDHQLFNGASSNCTVRSESAHCVFSRGLPNPEQHTPSLKAPTSASLGQLGGENSMVGKPSEIMLASYGSQGEDNEALQLSTLVTIPDTLAYLLKFSKNLVWHHITGHLFYVETAGLIWSYGQVAISNPKERGHLKDTNGGQYRNSGSPDGRKFWGDGGSEVAIPYLAKGSRSISTKVSQPAGYGKLGKLREENTKNTTRLNTKILDLMTDTDILIAAYTKLKSSSGNKRPGTESETLGRINKGWLDKLKKDLRTNAFQFRPARRIEIPQASGKVTRPLFIASPREKIVQGAMVLVLEAIYEPQFTPHSHGFRPGRSCHSALGEIKRTFTAVN